MKKIIIEKTSREPIYSIETIEHQLLINGKELVIYEKKGFSETSYIETEIDFDEETSRNFTEEELEAIEENEKEVLDLERGNNIKVDLES